MSRVIVLDATPTGLVCHANPRGDAVVCQDWVARLRKNGVRVVLPAIADFEVRRELVRLRRTKSLRLLDLLRVNLDYLELNDQMLGHAARLWAQARQKGMPTAGPAELDCDVILAAQALSLGDPGVVVATSNPGHLSRYVTTQDWQTIPTT